MLIIKNALMLQKGKLAKRHITIEGRLIKKISTASPAKRKNSIVIDAAGKLLLPGLIDCHVHMREPGFEYKEDFFSGSRAAAAGGVTTFIDMPNNNPATTTVSELMKKKELAKKCAVNYGFHFGTLGDNISEIREAWKNNIASVKVYMDETTGSMKVEEEKKLKEIFKASRRVCTHAEGKKAELALKLAKEAKTALYLCHLSSRKEMEMLAKEKNRRGIFAEATPHHLFLTEKDASNYILMKPELKGEEDRKALWHGISSGLISTVGTDHAPHTVPEKEFSKVYGVPGLETMLPLLLDAVNKKMLTLEKLVELTSANPARIFGIQKRGEIKPGNYADLVLADMGLSKKVENAKLFTKCGWSPFNERELRGWPVMTLVNGQIVFEDGNIHHIQGMEAEFS